LWNSEVSNKTRRQASSRPFVQSTAENDAYTLRKRFGSLQAALKKARLPVPKLGNTKQKTDATPGRYFESAGGLDALRTTASTYGEMS